MAEVDFLESAVKYSGLIAVGVTIFMGFIGLVHYLIMKSAEERGRQYDRYHKLLDDLNCHVNGDAPYIDRQIAVVYDMRNFPEYFPVSIRILERSIPRWRRLYMDSMMGASINAAPLNTLYLEAEMTLKFIKRRQAEIRYLSIAQEDRD